jgi:hypothetical protein
MMKNANTAISYALRILVVLHICFLGTTFVFFDKIFATATNPNNFVLTYLNFAATALVALLLLADWLTHKEKSRRFSKLIDSVIGAGWVLTMCVLTIFSLSMAIP